MNFETIAEKIIPTMILMLIGAMFNLYMDVEFLKTTAIDYKERADKVHEVQFRKLEQCTTNDIIQNKDIEFLKGIK